MLKRIKNYRKSKKRAKVANSLLNSSRAVGNGDGNRTKPHKSHPSFRMRMNQSRRVCKGTNEDRSYHNYKDATNYVSLGVGTAFNITSINQHNEPRMRTPMRTPIRSPIRSPIRTPTHGRTNIYQSTSLHSNVRANTYSTQYKVNEICQPNKVCDPRESNRSHDSHEMYDPDDSGESNESDEPEDPK